MNYAKIDFQKIIEKTVFNFDHESSDRRYKVIGFYETDDYTLTIWPTEAGWIVSYYSDLYERVLTLNNNYEIV